MMWAEPVVVTNEAELYDALLPEKGDVDIKVANDITLTKHVTVWHKSDIDLNGKTLHGDKTQVNGTDYKCIFIVAPEGEMTLHDGTLADADNSGSKSDEHGGGAIVNKGTSTLTNVTITGCISVTVGSCRAYFRLTNLQDEDSDVQWTVKTNLSDEEGLETVTHQPINPSTNKLIINGMLFIERNGKLYNAQGAEVR